METETKSSAVPVTLPSGAALHVEGPAGATPVLLLHGLGGAAWSWEPQREALRPDFRNFVLEMRGRGAAARAEDAGVADYFQDATEALAQALDDAQAPVALVGHSLGGLLALALAGRLSAAVRGLFLIDPLYVTGADAMARLWPITRPIAPLLVAAISRPRFQRWFFAHTFEDRARMEAAWEHQRAQVPIEYPRILGEAFAGPNGFELHDFARDVNDPTFVLEGSSGARRPRFPRLVRTLRERLGESFSYESIPGGHYLQLDRPDAVNQRIRNFLEKIAR